ncbi:hypothetical protein M8542_00295 [Amycolatopsis sp. OK19-0408]|uniref:Uncharacterized protein n=1 Tax=Amycolatopsis iheyensis TaxID=2945988 RepID=A0A9X2N622_9PSEU|nr:hypothetical protein [Amycolatopsis iheyensis]MCR6481248.1 hypothetical protein [Amycolatopsis iheyensis]
MRLVTNFAKIAVLMAFFLLGGSGVTAFAQTGGWAPGAVSPGHWKADEVDAQKQSLRVGTSTDDVDVVQTCAVYRSLWLETDHRVTLDVRTVKCPTGKVTEQAATAIRTAYTTIDEGSVLNRADDVYKLPNATVWGYGREWMQSTSVVVVQTFCGQGTAQDCLALNGVLSKSLSASLPGEPSLVGHSILQEMLNFGLTSLTLPWVFWVGGFGLASFIGRDRYAIPAAPGSFVDVERASRNLRWRSYFFGLVTGFQRGTLAFLLFAVGSLWFGFEVRVMISSLVLVLLFLALTWGRRKLDNPLFRGTVNALTREINVRTCLAALLRFAIRALTLLVGLVYVIACLSAAFGGPDGAFMGNAMRVAGQKIAQGSASPTDYLRFVGIFASGSVWVVGYFLIAFITVMLLVDRLALLLLTKNARELIRTDSRPPILYLRNFGDDKLKVRASRVSRRGLLGRLSFSRKRRFEETVAWRINLYSGVVAINDPSNFLPSLGAAKMNLAHNNWKHDVERLANSSLAVLVSATPTNINEGLRWELEMIAQRLSHRRVILLLAPRKKQELLYSWRLFVDAVRDHPFFDGIKNINPSGAALVVAHIPGVGWKAWGAKTRTEWTYSMAVHGALSEMKHFARMTPEPPADEPRSTAA